MSLFGASWQTFINQLAIFLCNVLPAVGASIVLMVIFWLGRFSGKLSEQRNILRHLPDIVRLEVQTRDKRIKILEETLETACNRYTRLLAIIIGLEKQAGPLIEIKE